MVRGVKGPFSVLWAAALAVFVIGLGNLASLALARSRGRLSELGTRLAIGAGRFDIVRQQLVEGLLIAVIGAVAGLALAAWMLSALRTRELTVTSSIRSTPSSRRHPRAGAARRAADRARLGVAALHDEARSAAARGHARRHARTRRADNAAGARRGADGMLVHAARRRGTPVGQRPEPAGRRSRVSAPRT